MHTQRVIRRPIVLVLNRFRLVSVHSTALRSNSYNYGERGRCFVLFMRCEKRMKNRNRRSHGNRDGVPCRTRGVISSKFKNTDRTYIYTKV